MALTFVDGVAVVGGRPRVLVAVPWEPVERTARARAQARELAAAGYGGIWVTSADELAVDAARRAGLAVLAAGVALPALPHVLVDGRVAHVGSVDAAWQALLGGERLLVGDESAVYGVARFLALTDDAAHWEPRPAAGGWLLAGGPGELAGYSPTGGPLALAVPRGEHPALHWIEPESGLALGLVTPQSGETHTLRTDEPLACYLGPNRWTPATDFTAGP